ncbi:Uncharacterised protein [uncultured archaeon]|nr:Uncharacterised protein [uncultured archaeon]
MTCDLGEEELYVLNLLYSKRNLRSDNSIKTQRTPLRDL